MNKDKLKKYLFGTQSPRDPWEKYEQIRMGRISQDPGNIEDPNTALMDNEIRTARATLDSNKGINKALDVFGTLALNQGMSMMSGGISEKLKGLMAKQNMAYGGEVGNKMVEIEGGETIEDKMGNLLEGFGPDHGEGGGVPAMLEEGSIVSSKRIKDKKGSMADKAKMRKKEEGKIGKLLEKNTTDKLLKNTAERVTERNELEKKQDLMLQSIIGAIAGEPGEDEKRPFGTSILEALKNINTPFPVGMTGTSDDFHGDNPYKFATPVSRESSSKGYMGTAQQGNMDELNLDPNLPKLASNSAAPTSSINPGEGDPLEALYKALGMGEDSMPTGGDLLGLFAQYQGATKPMENTLRSRATDTPNINFSKDFGKDALKVIQEGKQFASQSREDAEEDLRLSANAQRDRLRNSSRSANTMRAFDVAAEGKANQSRDAIRGNEMKVLAQLMGQEAQAENMQDQVVMQGEQQRDLADRQDKDNFYTNLAQDIAAKFENIQGIGNNLNSIKKRGDSAERIKALVESSKNSNSLREFLEAWLKIDQGDVQVKGKTKTAK